MLGAVPISEATEIVHSTGEVASLPNVDFGAFRLINGQLEHRNGKPICALKDVRKATNRLGMFMIIGPNAKGKDTRLLSVDMSTVNNVDAFYRLLDAAKE